VNWINQIHVGDCRDLMRRMIADGVRVQCIVTSPPYWGLRDYGVPGQFGLERTWVRHIARMRSVFRLARGLLAIDGVLWLNYGDSYYTPRTNGGIGPNRHAQRLLKAKDMVGMPWRIALALQADGWWLRSDVIWHKPNPMPESARDRPTKSHEYVFLLARSEHYFYDQVATREPMSTNSHPRIAGWAEGLGAHDTLTHAAHKGHRKGHRKFAAPGSGTKTNQSFDNALKQQPTERNMRTVWSIPTEAFNASHFATFPRELVRRCILTGSRPGDTVLDPFMGSGTVAEVASSLGRRFIGCELNPQYAAMFEQHRSQQQGMAI
jgi:DNA modification methylase